MMTTMKTVPSKITSKSETQSLSIKT